MTDLPVLPRFESAGLLLIDVQERLLPAMPEVSGARLVKSHTALLEMARVFDLPVWYTEQYPKGLGSTLGPLRDLLLSARRFEKTEFSACRNPDFAKAAERLPGDVIVTGMEAHVCVLLTALDLIDRGRRVFVPWDAVASRSERNVDNALNLIERAGGFIVNSESLIFARLEKASSDSFKRLSALVK